MDKSDKRFERHIHITLKALLRYLKILVNRQICTSTDVRLRVITMSVLSKFIINSTQSQ